MCQHADSAYLKGLEDDEIDDILPEDRGGNYVLVAAKDDETDIEWVGPGVYRAVGTGQYMVRRGKCSTDATTREYEIPVKVEHDKAKVKEKMQTAKQRITNRKLAMEAGNGK